MAVSRGNNGNEAKEQWQCSRENGEDEAKEIVAMKLKNGGNEAESSGFYEQSMMLEKKNFNAARCS